MQYLWLALAFLVATIGVFIGRFLQLSYPITVTLGAIPMFLVLFPFMKAWNPKLSFQRWVIAVVIGAAVSWAIYLLFLSRLIS